MNHWALEKSKKLKKNLKAQVYFDDNSGINLFLPAKSVFVSPVFIMKKTVFPPSGENLPTLVMSLRAVASFPPGSATISCQQLCS